MNTTHGSTQLLSATDRCDRCGARAYVLAVLAAGDLAFCAHHGRYHSAELAKAAVFVLDESDQLQAA